MKNRESIEQPKRINASELVNLLAQAGPASNLRVRIYFKKGPVQEGVVKWHDDRANKGPVIVIPNKNPFKEVLIPLGGHTVFETPPRVSSMDNTAKRMAPMFGEIGVHKIPIDSTTKDLSFELIGEK